jgi:FkbM family methyltransferase
MSNVMSDILVPVESVEWVDWNVGGYPVRVPKFLADYHGDRSQWERKRYESLESNLKRGDIVFDIGTEQAYCTVPIARMVGAGNMCLFEPSALAWSNIWATWNENGLESPRACWAGFVSNESQQAECPDYEGRCHRGVWPECAFTGRLLNATSYRYDSISEQRSSTNAITLDEFCAWKQIIPDALNIDVEGYELRVLQGAVEILKRYRPLVWLSEHLYEYAGGPGNNMLQRIEGGDPLTEQRELMKELGYEMTLLGIDHEAHYFGRPL